MKPMQLDAKGRCCGRKPLVYKREHFLFCPRCNAAFDPNTKEQIDNWAYQRIGDQVVCRLMEES